MPTEAAPARLHRRASAASAVCFAVLAVAQWSPWLLAELLPGAIGAVTTFALGIALFGLLAWAAMRLTRDSFGLTLSTVGARRCGGGLAVGALVYLAVFIARWLSGAFDVAAPAEAVVMVSTVLAGLVIAGYQAFSEELVFRGVFFSALRDRVSMAATVVLSTVVFVAFHFPKWDSLVGTPYALHLLLAGFAFGLARAMTGSLWLGIGLHFGWNLGAYLLLEAPAPIVQLSAAVPAGWHEPASWIGVAGNAALLLAVLWYVSRLRNARSSGQRRAGLPSAWQ